MTKSYISHFPTLDVKDVPIFHLVEDYGNGRDLKSLKNNEVIRSISSKDQGKVINSLLLPNPSILGLRQATIKNGSSTVDNFIRLILNLFEKIRTYREINMKFIPIHQRLIRMGVQ